jgi:hypothetical protein
MASRINAYPTGEEIYNVFSKTLVANADMGEVPHGELYKCYSDWMWSMVTNEIPQPAQPSQQRYLMAMDHQMTPSIQRISLGKFQK